MDRNDFSSMAAYADMLTQMNQAPRGLGPVAPGPEGVLSPESQARMLAYEEELKRQQQVPQLQHTPMDQIVAAMSGGNVPQPAYIGPQAGFQPSAPIPSDQPDFSNPAKTLPSKPKVKQPTEEAPEQQAAPVQEQSAPESTPETTTAAAQEIKKAVQDVVKTPEDEQLLNNAINRPTEDGSQSIAQRIAMIAMAVAPTAVGMALGGKKGAYIGGKATGDGLTAGAETYMKEEAADRAERKLDIESRKADKAAKTAAERNAFDKMFVDQEGKKWFYDANNQIQPVMIPSGPNGEKVQAREANVPIESYNPMNQQFSTRMKFEGTPQQGDESQTLTTLQSEIADARDSAKRVKIPQGLYVPKELDDLAAKYPNASMTGQKPEGISSKDWMRLKSTYVMWRDKKEKQIELFQSKLWDQENIGKKKEAERKVTEDKLMVKQDLGNMNQYRDKIFTPDNEKIKKAVEWLNMGGDTQAENAAVYFAYMKEAQQDPSVIREGDQRTIESFMNFGTKIANIQAVFDNKGKMSPTMKADILKFMGEVKRLREARLAKEVNNFANQAFDRGQDAYKTFTDGMSPYVKGDVMEYANRELAGKKPITRQQLAEAIKLGLIGNGSMYMLADSPGQVFIHTGLVREKIIDPQSGRSNFKLQVVGKPTPWRVK